MKKTIRFIVTAMVEVETELSPEEARSQFESESFYNYEDTEDVRVIQTEWRETKIVSTQVDNIFEDVVKRFPNTLNNLEDG